MKKTKQWAEKIQHKTTELRCQSLLGGSKVELRTTLYQNKITCKQIKFKEDEAGGKRGSQEALAVA